MSHVLYIFNNLLMEKRHFNVFYQYLKETIYIQSVRWKLYIFILNNGYFSKTPRPTNNINNPVNCKSLHIFLVSLYSVNGTYSHLN